MSSKPPPLVSDPKQQSASAKKRTSSPTLATTTSTATPRTRSAHQTNEIRELNATPHFYYIDHSRDVDANPLTPLAPPDSIPNFVIKLHAILVREEDLGSGGVVEWMPHGRSWKILDQVRRNIQ